MQKPYDILQLQKLSAIELSSIATENNVCIQNNFKQSLIYAILNKQASDSEKPSECHARHRYEATRQLEEQLNEKVCTQ